MADDIELTRTLIAKGELPGLVDELALRGSGPTASVLVFGNPNYADDLAARVAATKATDVNGRLSSLPTHMKVVLLVSGNAVDPVTGKAASSADLRASLLAHYGDTLATAVMHRDGLMPTVVVTLEPPEGTFRARQAFDKTWRPRTQKADKDVPVVSGNEKPATQRAASVIKPSLEWLRLLRVDPTLIEVAPVQGADETATCDELEFSSATTFPVVAASPTIAGEPHHAPACTVVESAAEDTAGVPATGLGPGSSPSIVPLDTANEPASLIAQFASVCRVPTRSRCHDPHRRMRRGALKRRCNPGGCRKPNAPLPLRRQQNRHDPRVDGADRAIALAGQEPQQALLHPHKVGVLDLRTAYTRSRAPDTGEGRWRLALARDELGQCLARLGIGVLARENWDDTALLQIQTVSIVLALNVVDVGDRIIAKLPRARDAPEDHLQDASTIPGRSHDGRAWMGEDTRPGRRISGTISGDPEGADLGLRRDQTVEGAQGARQSANREGRGGLSPPVPRGPEEPWDCPGYEAACTGWQAGQGAEIDASTRPIRGWVGPTKQIPQCPTTEQGAPASAFVLRAIVIDMAALAEGHEIAVEVVGGVVIAVSRSQYDPRRTDEAEILDGREAAQRTALPIAPGADAGIPPAPITEMVYRLPMRPTAALAGATCSPKADRGRELRPVDWGRRSGAPDGSA